MKNITMLLLKENGYKEFKNYKIKDITEELETIYKEINCQTIDITNFLGTNGVLYDVICDDEGLLKSDFSIILYKNYEPYIAGSVLISKSNDKGENIGLNQDDIVYLENNILLLFGCLANSEEIKTFFNIIN